MKRNLCMLLALVLAAGMLAGCVKNPTLKFETNVPGTSATVPGTEPTVPRPSGPAPTQPVQTDPADQPTEPQPTEPEAPSVSYTRAELEAMDTKVNGWGLGPHMDAEGRPVDAVRAQDKYGQYDAYFIGPVSEQIYLTFDEGYENGYTSQILDVLKEKDVKAVFFVTMPYVKSEPELIRRMIDEGHVVGNHSVNHKSMPKLSIDQMIQEVMDLHEYVQANFGYQMTLFRPPMGEFSQQSLAVLQDLGYKTVAWSFAYYDYDVDAQPAHDAAYQKIVDTAHKGAIYLLHAVSQTNTAVLGDVIDELRQQGYVFTLLQ